MTASNRRRVEIDNRAALLNLAVDQGGYFTALQASEAGIADNNHSRYVKSGQWARVARGIFRLTSLDPPDRPDFILATLWSRNRQGEPSAVVSHISAAAFWDMGEYNPTRLDVTVPPTFSHRSASPVSLELHRADLMEGDVRVIEGGVRITSPLRTVIDLMDDQRTDLAAVGTALHDAMSRGLISTIEVELYATDERTKATLSAWIKRGERWSTTPP